MVRKIEDEQENKSKVVIAKIGFLIALIITAILMQQFSSVLFKPSKTASPKKTQRSVLGVSSVKDLQEGIGENVEQIGAKTKQIQVEIQKQVAKLFEEKKSEIEASVSSALYDTAIKPVITQFNGLPEKQKEEVRGAICK